MGEWVDVSVDVCVDKINPKKSRSLFPNTNLPFPSGGTLLSEFYGI